jgi:hypothetical protein
MELKKYNWFLKNCSISFKQQINKQSIFFLAYKHYLIDLYMAKFCSVPILCGFYI